MGDIELTNSGANLYHSGNINNDQNDEKSLQKFQAVDLTYKKLSEITGKSFHLKKLFKKNNSLASFDTIKKIVNDDKFFSQPGNFAEKTALLTTYQALQEKKYLNLNINNLNHRNLKEKKLNLLLKIGKFKKILTPKFLYNKQKEIDAYTRSFEKLNFSYQFKSEKLKKKQKEVQETIQNKKMLLIREISDEIKTIKTQIEMAPLIINDLEKEKLLEKLASLENSLKDLDNIISPLSLEARVMPLSKDSNRYLKTEVINFSFTTEIPSVSLDDEPKKT